MQQKLHELDRPAKPLRALLPLLYLLHFSLLLSQQNRFLYKQGFFINMLDSEDKLIIDMLTLLHGLQHVHFSEVDRVLSSPMFVQPAP